MARCNLSKALMGPNYLTNVSRQEDVFLRRSQRDIENGIKE